MASTASPSLQQHDNDATTIAPATTTTPAAAAATEEHLVVVEEQTTAVGTEIGACKWFNNVHGYGFLTIVDGASQGTDVFVHHSGIKPSNSQYKTLKKGEYLTFDVVEGTQGSQAVNVRGICGGPLLCDHIPVRKQATPPPPPPPPRRAGGEHSAGWTKVSYHNNNNNVKRVPSVTSVADASDA
jgi:cold shock CspA family protein